MTVALMWEARAVPGRGPDLLAWVRAQDLSPTPLRRETFTAAEDRVLVITWWPAEPLADHLADQFADHCAAPPGRPDIPELPELPEPGPDLVRRAVHRWRFEAVD